MESSLWPDAPAVVDAGAASQTRTYYLAAEDVRWNYAPSGRNQITDMPFTAAEDVFVARAPGRIGSTYWKALYRGYTDATFTTPTPRDPTLGLLGPVLRAQVGDTLRVVLVNRTGQPVSLHSHGVLYAKDSEGAPDADGTSGRDKSDDAVPPGGTHTYVWKVPERAGPGPMDGSSVLWMYHSHTDEVADTNAGLVGPLVVTRRGMARADGSAKDVDREEFAYFSVMNENDSSSLARNIADLDDPASVVPEDEGFEESNLMHSVNGFVYGNGPTWTMRRGERVRWYVFSLGTEVDLHTPHWHGNTITMSGMRDDMVDLLPGDMVVADMQPDAPGTWLFHCHVNDHILAGMQARYVVQS